MSIQQQTKKPVILAILGSLRANSSTAAVIATAKAGISNSADLIVYEGIGDLPHFNDSNDPPNTVINFRKLLADSDGVVICTPEYAFGVPGMLKNALDWTVSSGEFVNKPVAVIVAATGGQNAFHSLILTLTALSANVPEDAKLLISFIRAKMNEHGAVKDAQTIAAINSAMTALADTIAAAGK